MILPASYANGFAPRDGQPLYPELWRGCVGAWAPCLGPTGLTLRDWSGLSHQSTLTNGAGFAVTKGRQAVAFDGTNDFGNCTYTSAIDSVGEATVFARVLTNTVGAGYRCIFSKGNGVSLYSYSLNINVTAAKISWYNNTSYVTSTGASLVAGEWYDIAAVRRGSTGAWTIDFYINGKLDSSVTTATNPSATGTTVSIGQDAGGFWSGSIADLRVYNRAVRSSEIATLSQRPGIAYEMMYRRRASVQVITGNRRRRLLVGAGS